ncbi:hypothetical protein H310_01341 [Aphanomyces invadans]|uniref:Chromo domain-containing protein n=1 Tax=Aphanomyces invadans TaxID=157072 RepID=A0A024USE2_9STRA|nr:hypothetical protein H310_01341 [Aphanomyces invadans]ETW08837.1 hypothetical protein H310_01341 [Aphanomyces invadans]|eukprot:XP_008862642.1 hypothetical protein H310_01341 [Aphanomyces invadans]
MELLTTLEPVTPLGKDIQRNLNKLRASLLEIHKEVMSKNEQRVLKAMMKTEGYENCNVTKGDYVLWSRVDERSLPKQIKMYAESSFEVTEEHVSEQGIMLKVRSIAGHKFVPDVNDFMLEVFWEGLEDIESSWEPLRKLMKECPAVVRKYVDELRSITHILDLHAAIKKATEES